MPMNHAEVVQLPVVLAFPWLPCVAMAARIGDTERPPPTGLLLGVLSGPLGVIMAACVDERPECPRCGGRLNGQHALCRHCGVELHWHIGRPMRADMMEP